MTATRLSCLQLILDLVCVNNVHTLITVMEVIGARSNHALAAVSTLHRHEIALTRTLRHNSSLVVKVRHTKRTLTKLF